MRQHGSIPRARLERAVSGRHAENDAVMKQNTFGASKATKNPSAFQYVPKYIKIGVILIILSSIYAGFNFMIPHMQCASYKSSGDLYYGMTMEACRARVRVSNTQYIQSNIENFAHRLGIQ